MTAIDQRLQLLVYVDLVRFTTVEVQTLYCSLLK